METPANPGNASKTEPQSRVQPSALPTTQETIEELRRRLGKELYQMEWDLKGGARIAGKPCDCLDSKHNLGLEAVAEELMSYERNPVYSQILSWLKSHQAKFTSEVIAQTDPDYYRGLAPEVRDFRKQVMGTGSLRALISKPYKVSLGIQPNVSLEKANPEAARLVPEIPKAKAGVAKLIGGVT